MNDAAERLLNYYNERPDNLWRPDDVQMLVKLERAAERRATVERIRGRIEAHVLEFANVMLPGQVQGYADCLAILDAEVVEHPDDNDR